MKTKTKKLPIYPKTEVYIGRGVYVTEKHLKQYIVENYPDIVGKYCIGKKFSPSTGEITYQYVWHSIMIEVRERNLAPEIINGLIRINGND